MDRVGLGRALGFGARQAARTAMKIAEAAAAPSNSPAGQSGPPVILPDARAGSRPGVRSRSFDGGKTPGRPVLKPVAKFTSVLWLEVTGFFYGVFAVILGSAAGRQWHAAFRTGAAGNPVRFYIYAGVAVVFAYFCLTNFLKARRRGRR